MIPETMKEWEDRLGPEKTARAIDLVRSYGWAVGDNPPMYVWAEAFYQVENGKEVWGGKSPSILETVLGTKVL